MPMQVHTLGVGRHGDSIRMTECKAKSDDALVAGDHFLILNGIDALQANEQLEEVIVPVDGHLENLQVSLNLPPGDGERIIVEVRINGVTSALFVHILDNSTRAQNVSNQVAVYAGNSVCLHIWASAGVHAGIYPNISCELIAY